MLAAAVAAALVSTPAPAPALTQLKTIAHMRATPFCSALREHVGPAIEHVMLADRAIDASEPIFTKMYGDDVVFRSALRMDFDVQRMENLITPIVSNIEAAEAELRDPEIGDIAKRLEGAIDTQKAALNVVSGFIATYQLGQIQAAGPPETWRSAFTVSPSGRTASDVPGGTIAENIAAGAPPGAAMLYGAGLPRTVSDPPLPWEQATTITLGSDHYEGYAQIINAARREGDAAEADASRVILAGVASCLSTP